LYRGGYALILTDDNFHEEISKGVVVVIMWVPNCPSCITLKPIMEEVARECPTVQFKMLNTVANQKTAKALGIDRVPMLFLFKEGERKASALVVNETGVLSKEQLTAWVNYRSTWEAPTLEDIPTKPEKSEVCDFCMATRRRLYSLLPSFIKNWLEKS
jgi:thioredoxin 1